MKRADSDEEMVPLDGVVREDGEWIVYRITKHIRMEITELAFFFAKATSVNIHRALKERCSCNASGT